MTWEMDQKIMQKRYYQQGEKSGEMSHDVGNGPENHAEALLSARRKEWRNEKIS